jgi:hypothetical protein
MKDVQATGEDSSPQENNQHFARIHFFFLFCGSFLPTWIRVRIPDADPDPNPADQIMRIQGLILDQEPWDSQ